MTYPHLQHAIEVIAKLRNPKSGCPWDLKQTHQSLLKYLIEESYEFIHATEKTDIMHMQEELGDVLLQVLLHAQIASEDGHFNIETVAQSLSEKMIERHPHVFGDRPKHLTSDEVSKNWKAIKEKHKTKKYHINIEDAYAPALSAADQIGAKSRDINFDWDHLNDVLAKVDEELQEVKTEIYKKPRSLAKTEEEIGDLLFSTAQLARHLNIDPELALKKANLKFISRVNAVEEQVGADGHDMKDLSTPELEVYWQKIKNSHSSDN